MTTEQVLAAVEAEMYVNKTSKVGKIYIRSIVRGALQRCDDSKERKLTAGVVLTPEFLLDVFSSIAAVTRTEIRSHNRRKQVSAARMLIMYMLRPHYPLTSIGRLFNRHHTTVMHAIKTVQDEIGQDSSLVHQYYVQYQTLVNEEPV